MAEESNAMTRDAFNYNLMNSDAVPGSDPENYYIQFTLISYFSCMEEDNAERFDPSQTKERVSHTEYIELIKKIKEKTANDIRKCRHIYYFILTIAIYASLIAVPIAYFVSINDNQAIAIKFMIYNSAVAFALIVAGTFMFSSNLKRAKIILERVLDEENMNVYHARNLHWVRGSGYLHLKLNYTEGANCLPPGQDSFSAGYL